MALHRGSTLQSRFVALAGVPERGDQEAPRGGRLRSRGDRTARTSTETAAHQQSHAARRMDIRLQGESGSNRSASISRCSERSVSPFHAHTQSPSRHASALLGLICRERSSSAPPSACSPPTTASRCSPCGSLVAVYFFFLENECWLNLHGEPCSLQGYAVPELYSEATHLGAQYDSENRTGRGEKRAEKLSTSTQTCRCNRLGARDHVFFRWCVGR